MKAIGLDLGTSSLKAILIDEDQSVLAEHTVALTVERPHDGWSEQDPAAWESAASEALQALAPQIGGLAAIGLSGHMHGATLIGARIDPPEGVVTRALADPALERTVGLIEARGRPLSGPALAFRRILQTVGGA